MTTKAEDVAEQLGDFLAVYVLWADSRSEALLEVEALLDGLKATGLHPDVAQEAFEQVRVKVEA